MLSRPRTCNAEADPPVTRGRPLIVREVNDTCTGLFPPGYWHWHACKMEGVATREALSAVQHTPTGSPQGSGRAERVAEWPVVPQMRGNARGGKGPQARSDVRRGKGHGNGRDLQTGYMVGDLGGITCESEGAMWRARHATGCYQGVNRPDDQRTQVMEWKQGPC